MVAMKGQRRGSLGKFLREDRKVNSEKAEIKKKWKIKHEKNRG